MFRIPPPGFIQAMKLCHMLRLHWNYAALHCQRKWKKDKSMVPFQMMRDSRHPQQTTVRSAKSQDLSDITVPTSHNPHVLLKTANPIFNAIHSACLLNNTEVPESFLNFFNLINKVVSSRALSPAPDDPSIHTSCSAALYQLELSLSYLEAIIGQVEPAGPLKDPIPPQLFKE